MKCYIAISINICCSNITYRFSVTAIFTIHVVYKFTVTTT